MERMINKRMILKGDVPCILNLSGGAETEVKVEWMRNSSEEPLFLFAGPQEYAVVKNEKAEIPTAKIIAAAIGKDFRSKGQFGVFQWEKARETVRMTRWIEEEKQRAETKPPAFEKPPEESTVERQKEPSENRENISDEPKKKEFAECAQCVRGRLLEKNPFQKMFPNSAWQRHDYVSVYGGWHYLTGTVYENGVAIHAATAVPGKYSMKPPAWLKEFSRYVQSEDGQGYWIALSPIIKK